MRFCRVNFSEDYGLAAEGAVFDPKTLFGAPAPGPMPTPAPPPVMPDPMSPDALAARRKAMTDASQGGRTSTTLTSPAAGTIAGGGGTKSLGG